jgi:ABC-type multidrug transport system ATPase subunit
MLHRPRLLLLDEPFTGLDPSAAIELRGRLHAQARAEGVGILLTTHDLHHVERICDRITVIQRGRVVASGTMAELVARAPGGVQEVRVTGENLTQPLIDALLHEAVVRSGKLEGPEAAVFSCSPEQTKQLARELVMRGVVLLGLAAQSRSLEDVFVDLVSAPQERLSGAQEVGGE